jgi:hypothetical protein
MSMRRYEASLEMFIMSEYMRACFEDEGPRVLNPIDFSPDDLQGLRIWTGLDVDSFMQNATPTIIRFINSHLPMTTGNDLDTRVRLFARNIYSALHNTNV